MQRWPWERVGRGKLLLCCVCSAARVALGRPRRKDRGGGISCRHAHSLLHLQVYETNMLLRTHWEIVINYKSAASGKRTTASNERSSFFHGSIILWLTAFSPTCKTCVQTHLKLLSPLRWNKVQTQRKRVPYAPAIDRVVKDIGINFLPNTVGNPLPPLPSFPLLPHPLLTGVRGIIPRKFVILQLLIGEFSVLWIQKKQHLDPPSFLPVNFVIMYPPMFGTDHAS